MAINWVQKAFRLLLTKAAGFPPWNPGGTFTAGGGTSGWGIFSSDAGITINHETALQCSAIWAAVRIRSLMIGHLPLNVYRRAGDVLVPAADHPLQKTLHTAPNLNMTSMEFRESVSVNFDLFGNAFVEIMKLNNQGGIALYPLESRKMTVHIQDNEPVYEYYTPKGTRTYKPGEIMHIRNFSLDGIIGLNPVQQQRHVLGTALAQQTFSAKMYRNGGRPSGVLEHPGALSPDAVSNIRENWEKVHSGADNAGKVAILWEGMKYNAVGMTADDMQFIESRKFQLGEIARIYGVPPHLLGDLERATFSNIEQQGIEFVTNVLAPYCVKLEQRLKLSLLSGEPDVYVKFNLTALMRGDTAARAQFYSSMVQNGIMTRNECRMLEELNPRSDADDLTVQSNMLDLSELAKVGQKK